ncbi:hypothetical protein D3C75_970740 [compost metagenome]
MSEVQLARGLHIALGYGALYGISLSRINHNRHLAAGPAGCSGCRRNGGGDNHLEGQHPPPVLVRIQSGGRRNGKLIQFRAVPASAEEQGGQDQDDNHPV